MPMAKHSLLPLLFPVLLFLALGACGKDGARGARAGGDGDDGGLPTPQATSGSVTGMPDRPGPGQVGAPEISGALPEPPTGTDVIQSPETNPETGMVPIGEDGLPLPPESAPIGEPTPQDAVAVVRDYHAAINARSFGRAYALWSGNGSASGQSPQQFADGFAETTGMSVELQAPGRIDAAPDARYIEVPVAVAATQRDGSVRRYVGAYTLRHPVVDGAAPGQRSWRITSADLREVR